MLKQRILTALALLPLVIGIIYWGGWLLVLLGMLLYLGINYEFLRNLVGYGGRILWIGLGLQAIIPIGFVLYGWPGFSIALLLSIMGWFVGLMAWVEEEEHQPVFQSQAPLTFLGIGYTGVLGSQLVVASLLPQANLLLLWAFAVTVTSDSLAYFGGRLIGGPKLAPRISPQKTISGGISGLVGAMLVGTPLFVYILPVETNWLFAGLMSFVTGVFVQLGDLVESFVKRICGRKDAGSILPGHGGILDRIDGLLYALIVCTLLAS